MADEQLIYRRIARVIEDGILSSSYKDDDPVPSTNQFARVYGINPATAAKGVNELVDEGILYKRRGLGMYVSPGARQKLMDGRRRAFVKGTLSSFMAEANKIELTREELVKLVAEYKEE